MQSDCRFTGRFKRKKTERGGGNERGELKRGGRTSEGEKKKERQNKDQ